MQYLNEEDFDVIAKNTFRPDGPNGRFEWLNTIHIDDTMKQYENKHPDFKNKLGKVFSNKMSHTYFMETFYLGVEGKIKEAKESARKALKLNFYFLNLGQYLFLLIPLPQLIQKIYQKIKEKKLPW